MERTIIFIRHAKSAYANMGQSDFDRPLNERGERDAPTMGKRLADKKLLPHLILSSTAKRTTQTAKKIAAEVCYDKDAIQWVDKLYLASQEIITEIVEAIDDKHCIVFLIAHNPGITYMVNSLNPWLKIDNVPTCGMVACSFTAKHWNDFTKTDKKILFFDYPKN